MRVLITSSRMPYALDMIRKLTRAGHEVYAADAYEQAPGSHSKYVAGHFVYPSARGETEAFIDELERIVGSAGIEVVVPAFEEAFFISTQLERLSARATIFAAAFPALARLHDKAAFEAMVRRLGLPIPETVVATSDSELAGAIGRFERYFARAVFSRGGVALLTNAGPLAGVLDPAEVHPSEREPWVVQPFVEGETVCTYSTVRSGRISAHLMYRIPRQWHHSTGIQFESVDARESLRLIEPIAAELGYTGQISFDFLVTGDGLSFVECNPRATDGLLLLEPDQLARGLFKPAAETVLLAPGATVQLDLALIGDAFSDRMTRVPKTIRDLARFKDAGDGWHDPLPNVYSALSLAHFEGISHREHAVLQDAMDADMSWDGEPIKGMSDADARLLSDLRAG